MRGDCALLPVDIRSVRFLSVQRHGLVDRRHKNRVAIRGALLEAVGEAYGVSFDQGGAHEGPPV